MSSPSIWLKCGSPKSFFSAALLRRRIHVRVAGSPCSRTRAPSTNRPAAARAASAPRASRAVPQKPPRRWLPRVQPAPAPAASRRAAPLACASTSAKGSDRRGVRHRRQPRFAPLNDGGLILPLLLLGPVVRAHELVDPARRAPAGAARRRPARRRPSSGPPRGSSRSRSSAPRRSSTMRQLTNTYGVSVVRFR